MGNVSVCLLLKFKSLITFWNTVAPTHTPSPSFLESCFIKFMTKHTQEYTYINAITHCHELWARTYVRGTTANLRDFEGNFCPRWFI